VKKVANSLESQTPSIIDSSEWESQIPKSPEDMHNKKLEIVTSPGGRDGLRILVVKGRLTIETVASFQDAIRKEHAQELIVDMSGVPSMDSAGLGVMIAACVHAKKTSRKKCSQVNLTESRIQSGSTKLSMSRAMSKASSIPSSSAAPTLKPE
jgi:anti-anti-sigma factor